MRTLGSAIVDTTTALTTKARPVSLAVAATAPGLASEAPTSVTAAAMELANALAALRNRREAAGSDTVALAALAKDYAALATANGIVPDDPVTGEATTSAATSDVARAAPAARAATAGDSAPLGDTTAAVVDTKAPAAEGAVATAHDAAELKLAAVSEQIAGLDGKLEAALPDAARALLDISLDTFTTAVAAVRSGIHDALTGVDAVEYKSRLTALQQHYNAVEHLDGITHAQMKSILHLFGRTFAAEDRTTTWAPLPDADGIPAGDGTGTASGGGAADPVTTPTTAPGGAASVAEPPAVTVPAATVPAVETPPVTVPAVDVPIVAAPTVPVPAVETPAATVPAVDVPVAASPTVTAPAVEAPPVAVPAVDVPIPAAPTVPVPAVPVVTAPSPAVSVIAAPTTDPLDGTHTGTIDYAANKAVERTIWLPTFTVSGGSGNDKIRFTLAGSATSVTLGDGHNTVDAQSAGMIGTLTGGSGVDEVILGMTSTVTADLGAGDDVLTATGSVGTVYAGAGNDRVVLKAGGTAYGGDGNDVFQGSGTGATFNGDAGDDALVVSLAGVGVGRTTFNGGVGTDTVRINTAGASAAAVTALFAELNSAQAAPGRINAAALDLSGVERIEVNNGGTITVFTF